MELIKTFMGILLLICLSFSLNIKATKDYLLSHSVLKNSVDVSSPLGVLVSDFKGRVKITNVLDYTPAYNAGLEPGDRILKVNGCKVCNVKEFLTQLEDVDFSQPVQFTVYRVDSCSTFPVDVVPFGAKCK